MVQGMHNLDKMTWAIGNQEPVGKPIGVFLAGTSVALGEMTWVLGANLREPIASLS